MFQRCFKHYWECFKFVLFLKVYYCMSFITATRTVGGLVFAHWDNNLVHVCLKFITISQWLTSNWSFQQNCEKRKKIFNLVGKILVSSFPSSQIYCFYLNIHWLFYFHVISCYVGHLVYQQISLRLIAWLPPPPES